MRGERWNIIYRPTQTVTNYYIYHSTTVPQYNRLYYTGRMYLQFNVQNTKNILFSAQTLITLITTSTIPVQSSEWEIFCKNKIISSLHYLTLTNPGEKIA